MNSNELLVNACILNKNPSWMPKEETIYLKDDDDGEIDQKEQDLMVKKNNSKVMNIEGYLKNIHEALNDITAAVR